VLVNNAAAPLLTCANYSRLMNNDLVSTAPSYVVSTTYLRFAAVAARAPQALEPGEKLTGKT